MSTVVIKGLAARSLLNSIKRKQTYVTIKLQFKFEFTARSNLNAAKLSTKTKYETLSVTVPKPFVYNVELNRPDKLNAINSPMWM